MRQKSGRDREPAEKVVKDIRSATRRKFSAEEKIRIVLECFRYGRCVVACASTRVASMPGSSAR
jgi:transposase